MLIDANVNRGEDGRCSWMNGYGIDRESGLQITYCSYKRTTNYNVLTTYVLLHYTSSCTT